MENRKGNAYYTTIRILTFLGSIFGIYGLLISCEFFAQLFVGTSFNLPSYFWIVGISLAALVAFWPTLPPKVSKFSAIIKTDVGHSDVIKRLTCPHSFLPEWFDHNANSPRVCTSSELEFELEERVIRKISIKLKKGGEISVSIVDQIEPNPKDFDITIYGRSPEVEIDYTLCIKKFCYGTKINMQCTMREYNSLLKLFSIFRNNEKALV